MDKRQTVESIKARQIFEEIRNLSHPFQRTYGVFEADSKKIGATLRDLLGGSSKSGVTIAVTKDSLVVGTKTARREGRLEKMIRKLALHVDDENLYNEAMALLGMEV
jgi:hypothetical protein